MSQAAEFDTSPYQEEFNQFYFTEKNPELSWAVAPTPSESLRWEIIYQGVIKFPDGSFGRFIWSEPATENQTSDANLEVVEVFPREKTVVEYSVNPL